MPVTIGGTLSFCGQDLAADDIALVRRIIGGYPNLSQTELASTICELLDWRRRNGGLKSRECFLFLRQLQQRGWVESLPALRTTKQPGSYPAKIEASSDPQPLINGPLADYLPLDLRRVQTPRQGHLFRQYIHRYHYLGFKVPYGASLRYIAHCRNPPHHPLACLLFKSAAWRMAPRDQWIGWSD